MLLTSSTPRQRHRQSTASDADHRRLRRIQSHAFSTKALELQKPVLQRHITKFHTCLRDTAYFNHGMVEMTNLFNSLTIDLIGDLAFSEDFGSLDAGTMQPQLQMLFSRIKQFTFVKEILRLPSLLAKATLTVLSAVMKGRSPAVQDVGAEVMMKRHAKSEVAGPDMVSYLLRKGGLKDGGYVCQSFESRLRQLTHGRMTPKELDKAGCE